MKKLAKIHINSDRILREKELTMLKGGTSYVFCRTSSGSVCYEGPISTCDRTWQFCTDMCNGSFDYAVCAGY